MQEVDQRITLAREYLAAAGQRDIDHLPPSRLMAELAETRQLGQVLAAIADQETLILAASLVMLHKARNRRPAPPLARFALWLGITATLGSNAAYGAPYGPLGVIVSTWPAVSFVLAVEVAIGMVHRARGGGCTELLPYTRRPRSHGSTTTAVNCRRSS